MLFNEMKVISFNFSLCVLIYASAKITNAG